MKNDLQYITDKILYEDRKLFKEFNIKKTIYIKEFSNGKDKILDIKVKEVLNKKRFINTPMGISLDGKILTGIKIKLSYLLEISIKYISNDLNGELRIYKTNVWVNSSINCDEKILKDNNFSSKILIEDVKVVNSNELFLYITGFIMLEEDF